MPQLQATAQVLELYLFLNIFKQHKVYNISAYKTQLIITTCHRGIDRNLLH